LLFVTGSLWGADWPQFRGPEGRGYSEERGLPTHWSATQSVAWKAALPGRGLSCPVIAGGRVYVTACSLYRQRRLHVLCYDAADGRKLWERQLAATGSTTCHVKTCMAAPTPVTDGRAVYALFASGDLAAFDREGTLLWYRALCQDYAHISNQVGLAASPVLAGDTLLLPLENAENSFAAGIDTRTGRNRWKVERPRGINWVTPCLLPGEPKVTLFQTPGEVTAYEAATGKTQWTYRGEGLSDMVGPVAGKGMIFVSGQKLRALRPGTNEPVWETLKLQSAFATPLYYQERIYGLSNATLTCLDAATGDRVWQKRLRGPYSASPILADGKIYAVNEVGTTSVVELGRQPRVLAENALEETILATPSIADGAIYLRSDQHLFCIRAKK
jgi:outer membrane protein assembly factor BamB